MIKGKNDPAMAATLRSAREIRAASKARKRDHGRSAGNNARQAAERMTLAPAALAVSDALP